MSLWIRNIPSLFHMHIYFGLYICIYFGFVYVYIYISVLLLIWTIYEYSKRGPTSIYIYFLLSFVYKFFLFTKVFQTRVVSCMSLMPVISSKANLPTTRVPLVSKSHPFRWIFDPFSLSLSLANKYSEQHHGS